MIDLSNISSVYLLGIGGIGMSALARYFHRHGARVAGYDKTPSALTQELVDEGIKVSYDEHAEAVPESDLYIYTPAIPKKHPAFEYVSGRGGIWYKRSEVLEGLAHAHETVAVAGTHGKTTTTAIIAHLWNQTRGDISAFVGGIMSNYDSNLIANDEAAYIVAEADEYDRSFLRLNPAVAVITSMDPDHLDIYGSHDTLKSDFQLFASKARKLILHERIADQIDHPSKIIYGKTQAARYSYQNLRVEQGEFLFDCSGSSFRLKLPGEHNVENATAAIAVMSEHNVPMKMVAEALASFRGVKRRFERVFESRQLVIIDDYAHHPKEIDAAVNAARMLFPGEKIAAIFQPHLYSRTRDLEDDFAVSLSAVDHLILMPIYPAREEPIPGVSSANLLNKVTLKTKQLAAPAEVVNAVLSLSADVVLVLGAGDIDRIVEPLTAAAKKKYHVE